MLREVSIEILRKCPNHCVHCSSLSDEQCSEMLEYEKFISVVTDAVSLGASIICFSGGEPFLHPQIIDMIEFTSSLGLQTYVYTSGIIFNDYSQKASLNADVLKAISKDVTKLIFNIEASKSSTYDKIMGTTECFDKMKQSIGDAHSFAITTEAHFVPMKLNVGEVEDVIDLCKELDVSKLSFLRLVLHGRAQENEALIGLSDEELEKLRVVLVELKEQSAIDIRIGVPLSTDKSCHKCEAANGKLNIKYDGNVFPCEVFKNDKIEPHLQGCLPESIYDRSLRDIYKEASYLKLVRNLSQEFACSGHCETCIGQYLINKEGEK